MTTKRISKNGAREIRVNCSVRQPFLRDDCNLHDAIVVLDERSTVDKARQRFADNVALLTKHDPELAVMGDREWTNACTNEYIQHMAKVLWMRDYTEQDILSVTKAVKGYLLVMKRKAEAEPMIPGGRIIHGEICTVRQHCEHGPSCQKHWRMNVRDYTHKNTIYTPIPYGIMQMYEPKDLVGMSVKYYAHISVSERDNTFGFAHRPKLMEVERKES